MSSAVLLAAVVDGRGSLWTLSTEGGVQVGEHAVAAWEFACDLVPATLPVLWREVSDLPPPRIAKRWGQGTHVDGASFGLAFALSVASDLLNIRLPNDFVATAALRDDGTLQPVDGLEAKIRAVRNGAPEVRHVIVAAEQAAEARKACAKRGIKVVAVRTLGEALDHVFPNINDHVTRQLQDERAPVVDRLLALAFGSRHTTPAWKPVVTACELAANTARDPEERFLLHLAQRVARRHDEIYFGEPADQLEMDWAALEQLPEPWRTNVRTHLVQQSSDQHWPPATQLRDNVQQFIHTDLRAFPIELKLANAFANHLLVTGKPEDAFTLAAEVIEAWSKRRQPGEMSHPFRVLFLASPLTGRLEDAETLFERYFVRGADRRGDDYVDLFRARAHLSTDPSFARRLAPTRHAAWFVRASSERCRLAAARLKSDSVDRTNFNAAFGGRDDKSADVFRRLLDLDEALFAGDGDEVARLTGTLTEGDDAPRPLPLMVKSYNPSDVPRFVADNFPY